MIAVVTVVAGRHEHLRLQLAGLRRAEVRAPLHVVVSMADPDIAEICGSAADVIDVERVDGRLPVAAARNAGAEHAMALGADNLIFLDVDCVPAPDLVAQFDAALQRDADSLLSGCVAYLPPPPRDGYVLATLPQAAAGHPARPQPAAGASVHVDHRLFWSLCFGVRADVWRRIGGFDEGYTGYGGEDTDFGETARACGVPHLMSGSIRAWHQWHPSSDPPLQHLDDILRNGRRFSDRWGYWPMGGWLDGFARLGVLRYDPNTDDWLRSGEPSAVDPLEGEGLRPPA